MPVGLTILEALLRIQSEQDGSLAFRYACRGAVCGSCAMLINGHIDLACRTQVRGLDAETITVEPLPNLPVLKDLVVDMEPFFENNYAIQPWLQPTEATPERERLVDTRCSGPRPSLIPTAFCAPVATASVQPSSGTLSTWGQRRWPSTIASWPTCATSPTTSAWRWWIASRACGVATWSGTVSRSVPKAFLPPRASARPGRGFGEHNARHSLELCVYQ